MRLARPALSSAHGRKLRPAHAGALLGWVLVAALYLADGALRPSGGSGLLALAALPLLAAPGALAAALVLSAREGSVKDPEKEGAMAGLGTAHFAAALLSVALVAGALSIDWSAYARRAGEEVAAGVRAALLPASLVAALASLVVVYCSCVAAGWLGAAVYSRWAARR